MAKKAFNIALLTNDRKRIQTLGEVTSMEMYAPNKDFHPEGLYSTAIFGRVGSKTRMKRHGWIDLRCEILHPKMFLEISALKELYRDILQGTGYAVWDEKEKDFVKADVLDGETGYAFFMRHWKEFSPKRGKSMTRNLVIDVLEKYRDTGALMNFIPVLPAGLRDLEDDEESEFGPLYRSVIAAASTIPQALNQKNDPIIDKVRWTLQSKVQLVWEAIINVIKGDGKNGMMRAKWASRRVAYATANVISAMDPAGVAINSPRSYDLTETLFGVLQVMKGNENLMALDRMAKGIARRVIESGGEQAPLIDPKTMKRSYVDLKEKTVAKWCTEAGRVDLINGFEQLDVRSRPVTIDGHYLALVVDLGTGIKVVTDPETIPESIAEKATIRPMTWGEYFYHETHTLKDDIRCVVTRYPVADDGSNYPSKPYLRSTMNARLLYTYDDNWEISNDVKWEEWPSSDPVDSWFNTMSVSQYYLAALGADHDGDRTQAIFLNSKEAVEEIDKRLDSPEHYLNTSGGMKNSYGVETLERVFRSFTPHK